MFCSQLRPVSNTSNTSALSYSHQHASCICRRRTNTLGNLNKSILQFGQIRFAIGSQQYKQNVGCFIFLPACILHDMIYRRRTMTNIKQTRSGKKKWETNETCKISKTSKKMRFSLSLPYPTKPYQNWLNVLVRSCQQRGKKDD